MRVTKLIREYVTETVENAIPVDTEAIRTCKEVDNQLRKMHDELEECGKKMLCQLLEETKSKYNLPEGYDLKPAQYTLFRDDSDFNTPIRQASRADTNRIRDRRAEAVKKILLDLELGATKNELEDIIAKAIAE